MSTFRAFKHFFMHSWGQWSTPRFRPTVGGGGFDYQHRTCSVCGLVEEKKF